MSDFDFDPQTREYSKVNAYWLGCASQLAYRSAGKQEKALKIWGLQRNRGFDDGDTQAFAAENDKMIILAFRGTEPDNIVDWITDLDAFLTAGPVGRVHEGFLAALNHVWPELWAYVHNHRRGRALWITGHSLGGALAVLAASKLLLERQEPINGLYTFGQPRVGDFQFANAVETACKSFYFRYVNNKDVVPRVPLRTMRYADAGTLKYFDENGKQGDEPGWWLDRLAERLTGDLTDVLVPEGLVDHDMAAYVAGLRTARGEK